MKATITRGATLVGLTLFISALGLPGQVHAQGGFAGLAPPEAMDTLSGGNVGGGTGAGMRALNQVRGTQPGAGLQQPAAPGQQPGGFGQGALDAAGALAESQPMIKVLRGVRIFDAVSGELLEDARIVEVPAEQRDDYTDENSDEIYEDYTVNDPSDPDNAGTEAFIGQSSQRIKERLVKALVVAEGLSPLNFYGFDLMSTDRYESAGRNVAWKMVPDPAGGPGFVIEERPVERPLVVPKYREYLAAKDERVKEDWARSFLDEYRVEQANLISEFHSLYIPKPPQVPTTPPPVGWEPFSDPNALRNYNQQQGGGRGGGGIAPGGGGGIAPGGGGGFTGGGGFQGAYF